MTIEVDLILKKYRFGFLTLINNYCTQTFSWGPTGDVGFAAF